MTDRVRSVFISDVHLGTRACQAMAEAGRGRRFHAPTYVALPRVIREVIRVCFRS